MVNAEIEKRDRKIERDKEMINELKEENLALRQLLDCAAANISLLVRDRKCECVLSANEVREALCKYVLSARRDGNGNYVLAIREIEKSSDSSAERI